MSTVSVFLAGVGGQGIILSSKIIAAAAEISGYDVTTSEIHGMAQRGGSVTAQIRFGKKVCSPLILEGTAQVLGATEPIEAIRYAHYLAQGGLAVVSSEPIIPVTVSSGQAVYPEHVVEQLRKIFPRLTLSDFDRMAAELGNIRLSNTLLLGAMSRGLDLPETSWKAAIIRCVKPAFAEINAAAFDLGRKETSHV